MSDPALPPVAGDELGRAFARVFAGADGARVLAHLRAITVERRLGPEASEALLRHVEGQRHIVAHVESLVARGRAGAGPTVLSGKEDR